VGGWEHLSFSREEGCGYLLDDKIANFLCEINKEEGRGGWSCTQSEGERKKMKRRSYAAAQKKGKSSFGTAVTGKTIRPKKKGSINRLKNRQKGREGVRSTKGGKKEESGGRQAKKEKKEI